MEYCETECCAEYACDAKLYCPKCLYGKLLVVLDLDQTLIVARNLEDNRFQTNYDFNINQQNWVAYKRPHLDEFLEYVFTNCEVCIWTAGSKPYAECVLKHILKPNQVPRRVLSVDDTTRQFKGFWESPVHGKPLNKLLDLGILSSRMLILDDHTTSFAQNPRNGMHVLAFKNPDLQANDCMLLRIRDLLQVLSLQPDVRQFASPHFDCTNVHAVCGTIMKINMLHFGTLLNSWMFKHETQQDFLTTNPVTFFMGFVESWMQLKLNQEAMIFK
jgi:hypothetical protein